MGLFAFSCNKVVTLKTVSVNTLVLPKVCVVMDKFWLKNLDQQYPASHKQMVS